MVSNLSAGAEQQSPFDQFRARSLLTWPLLTFLVIGVVTVSVTGNTVSDLGNNTILAFEIEAVYALWIIWQCRRHCISIPQLFGPLPRNPRTWVYVALAVPLVALSTVTVWLRVRVSHFLLPQLGTSFTNWLAYRPQFGHAADVWTVVSLVQGLTLVPVVEELLFRGLLFHRWVRKWGVTRGLLVSSCAFCLMHKDMLGAFVFGLVMALLYMRTRSLMIPIACHALDVALVFMIQGVPRVSTWWNLSLCLPVALPVLLLFLHRHWPGPNSYLPYSLSEKNKEQTDSINRI